ncbi:MAG: hypothetical protein ACRD2N_23120 [Vicinamibacterales bacterium]
MGPAVLVRAALILLVATAAIVTPTDADLWGHLTFGRDIVTSGTPLQTDVYSFTSDRAWVNHEWLAEVSFFSAYRVGGSAGLILFKLAIIATLLACVWTHLRKVAPQDLCWFLVGLTFVGTFWRTHNVRPQLFSVLLFTFVLLCIKAADAGRRTRLYFVPPIVALWANLHGGWVVGLAVYGLWAIARTTDQRVPLKLRVLPLAIGLLAGAATLLNPWGSGLWTFLAETVRPARADIEEWAPVTQYPLALGIPWGLTVASGGLALWRGGLPSRLDYLGVIGVLSVLAFFVGRLDAFFVLAVVILLAPQLAASWKGGQAASASRQQRGMVAVTVIGVLGMLVPVARFVAPYSTCLPIGGAWAPDSQGARFISENRLTGRMLTWFDWGEYVIWHFGPALRVSMDGRRETVYSDATIQAHRRFYEGDATAIPYLRQLTPDFLWLPSSLAVARQMESAGWSPLFAGLASTIWSRSLTRAPSQSSERPARSELRCFPGP